MPSAPRLGGLWLLGLVLLLTGLTACNNPPAPTPPVGTDAPPVTAAQETTPTESDPPDEDTRPTLLIKSAEVAPGDDTVQVELHLQNNPGLAGLQFTLHYGSELILTDVDFDNRFGAYTTAPTPYESPQLLTFASPLKDIAEEGRFATLTFRVEQDTPPNTTVQLYARIVRENTCNGELEEVEFCVVNGTVRIREGDLASDTDAKRG